jgi:hypothetical protein
MGLKGGAMEISGNNNVIDMAVLPLNKRKVKHNDPIIKGKIAMDGKPTDLVVAAKSLNEGKPGDLVVKGKSAMDGKAGDLVVGAKKEDKGKQTDLIISAENKDKSEKSSKAALDNFARKNPASWASKNGQKTGPLSPQPFK